MSVFVLVHGGASGGWIWSQVTPFLRKAGHEVFTPTLTGLGERAHLANPEVGLDTHIQDIVGVLECEDLQDVILLGYSYGVMPVTGAAEKVPERMSRLVYLDAPPPKNRQKWFDILGPEISQAWTDLAKREGEGWRFPLSKDTPKWQPHPLKTCTDIIEVTNPEAAKIPRAYIHCIVRDYESFAAPMWNRFDTYMEKVKQQGNWYRAIDADHFVALTKPKELSDLLLELA
jgi:pimeloyl-ACP methyl ester carboxylesterase